MKRFTKISHPKVREVTGDREAYYKALKEETEKPQSEMKIVLWIRPIQILDESSMREHTSVKELLCYLKFGKCDSRTMEIYEKLKDPSQGDD